MCIGVRIDLGSERGVEKKRDAAKQRWFPSVRGKVVRLMACVSELQVFT